MTERDEALERAREEIVKRLLASDHLGMRGHECEYAADAILPIVRAYGEAKANEAYDEGVQFGGSLVEPVETAAAQARREALEEAARLANNRRNRTGTYEEACEDIACLLAALADKPGGV